MAWRTKIQKPVNQTLNALRASDQLSRRGLIRAYNAVRLELPKHARRFQTIRYIYDPDCFLYTVNFQDKGVWLRLVFYVNDVREPGSLVVEDVEYKPK
jgi:hypothetical protein